MGSDWFPCRSRTFASPIHRGGTLNGSSRHWMGNVSSSEQGSFSIPNGSLLSSGLGQGPSGRAIRTHDLEQTLRARFRAPVTRRLKGTPEEYQAVVQCSLAHFGTYSVNEAEGTFTLHVESSTFPNYNGTDQIRIVTSLSRDEMKVTNPSPTTPTKAYVVYKRL